MGKGCKRCPNGSFVPFDKAPGKHNRDCKSCPLGKNYTDCLDNLSVKKINDGILLRHCGKEMMTILSNDNNTIFELIRTQRAQAQLVTVIITLQTAARYEFCPNISYQIIIHENC